MRPRGAGAALPLHLATHLHPGAARQHAGCQLLAHPLPHRRAGALPAGAAGAAHRGGWWPHSTSQPVGGWGGVTRSFIHLLI